MHANTEKLGRPMLRAEIINPLIESTLNVVQTVSGLVAESLGPRLKQDQQSYGDVTGLIGLTGAGAQGSFAVSFTEACILRIVEMMFGEPMETVDREVIDAVGELTNMISGGARATLASLGHDFEMALPTVIARAQHSISFITRDPVIVVPFRTSAGPFFVEACLHETLSEG